MNIFYYRMAALVIATLGVTTSLAEQLTIGSRAPNLDIAYWISDAGGKLKKVSNFEPNQVYVVEFWATWCGPCVNSMPHLAKLQYNYLGQGVQIVSISDEPLETVNQFLDTAVPGTILKKAEVNMPNGQALSFRQLTAGYCLTTDPDKSVFRDYMDGSGQSSIPTAFIVGKQGLIEWIGHPMEIDQPLQLVVQGKWDRERYLNQLNQRRALEKAVERIFVLLDEGKNAEAIKRLDELIQANEGEERIGLAMLKIQVLLENDTVAAVTAFNQLAAEASDAESLNMIAWQIVEAKQSGATIPPELIRAATKAAGKASGLAPKDGAIMDTYARLTFLSGDLDRAIALQTKAVELMPVSAERKAFLEELISQRSKIPPGRSPSSGGQPATVNPR